MQQRTKAVIVLLLGIFLVISYWGCDLMDGDFTENQIPEVIFVNVPTAGDTFNYAPVVHWTGHDPDGQIVQYQYRYRGDTTQAAFDAYAAWIDGNAMALTRYCDDHPAIPWEAPTESTEDTIYLKRNEADSLTRTVFMIRCFDNLGGVSLVKGKLFSRTNQAPFAPRIKWARDTELETERGFLINYSVSDTLLWGDTLTLTYPGIGFLWQGRDPDSRALNIIPLRFSYLLVNETTGDTMPYPMRDDENRIVGYRIGWSDTTSHTQVTFTSANVTNARRFFDSNWNFELDGSYRLKVEVFDDGFTKCDTPAVATFSAVRPLWNDSLLGKQLLLVDWNKTPTSTDYSFGLTDDQIIRDFYESALPEGFALGEQLRQAWYPTAIPKPFEFTPDQVQWHEDKVICEPGGVPYDRIRYFKWIWIINDNPPRNPCSEPSVIYDRLHVLQEYMNSGGQVMISGRGLFYKTFGLANPGNIDGGNPAGYYLRTYHNLTTIYPKVGVIAAEADFNEAATTSTLLAPMVIDSQFVYNLNFRNQHYWCLPEVDYFGRTSGGAGFDYSETIFNYRSCTANLPYDVTNADCEVITSTASIAYLAPLATHTRILEVSRVFNVTRNVTGEFMYVDRDPATFSWRIVVSTPASAGAWTTADVLEVDYRYIPIAPSNDQPVGTVFVKIQGLVEIINGRVFFTGVSRYRSALVTFPFSFMKNDEIVSVQVPYGPVLEAKPMSFVIARALLFFNEPGRIDADFSRSEPWRPGSFER